MNVMKTSLTIIPMCPRERFSLYKSLSRLILCCIKDWSTLLHFFLPLLLLARYKISFYQTICYRQFQCLQKIPCWKPLVISFYSSLGLTLLLIKRTTIDPLYLWVIKTLFWCRFREWSALGKEKLLLHAEIYCHLLLWRTILWGVCSGYLHLDRNHN